MAIALLTLPAAAAGAALDDGVHDNPMGVANAPWDLGGV